MKCSIQTRRRSLRGFTIKELAVVVAVVVVASSLMLAALSSARERARRVQCRANLRQIGVALKSFADSHENLLPDCSEANPDFSGASWAWDVNTNVIDELEQRGALHGNFYCPANPGMNDLSHWDFWRSTQSRIRVISYGLLLYGKGQIPPEFWRKDLSGSGAHPPAQTELGFDATVSMRGDFRHVMGTYTDRSNHLGRGVPFGGNVLFEDQHVDWRDFVQMQFRFNNDPDVRWYF